MECPICPLPVAGKPRDSHNEWFGNRGLVLLMLLFFVALLPILAGGLNYFGDERFYTDAAIRMAQRGDYLTPYYLSDGLPHFNKPILTYYAVLAGYKLLGVGFLGSRLPSLIAGCLLLWLTYKTSLVLFNSERAAFLGALMLFSNIIPFSASTRATPDIFQTLFLTLSLYGFAQILFNRDRSLMNYAAAYLGAALAVETKGIPGILVVAYVFLFCLSRKRLDVGCRQLVEWKMMVVASLVASFWFAAVYLKHGSGAIIGHTRADVGFLADQIDDNIVGLKYHPLKNIAFYVWSTIRHFFPWSVLLVLSLPIGSIRSFWRDHKEKLLFAFGWYLLLLVIFCAGRVVRGRYLFPSYPLLSVVVGAVLAEVIPEGRSAGLLRKFTGSFLIAGALLGATLALSGIFMGGIVAIGGMILLVVNTLFLLASRCRSNDAGLAAIGICQLLVFAVWGLFLRPAFEVSPERAMAKRLMERCDPRSEIAAVDLPPHASSLISLWSGGRRTPIEQPPDTSGCRLRPYDVVLLSEAARDRLDLRDYQIDQCGFSYDRWRATDIRDLLRGQRQAVFERKKHLYFIAIRIPSSS